MSANATVGIAVVGQAVVGSTLTPVTLFTPPTAVRVMDPSGRDFLWSRVRYSQGNAVVKTTSGSYRQVQVHDPDAADIDTVYLGGHEYAVTDEEAANLTAAGYAANLTVVTT